MAEPTHYETLGIAPGATAVEIKKAFRTLAKKFHPDRNKGQKFAEQKFKEINRAYETLKDPENRARYDRTLAGEPDSGDTEEYEPPKWEPTAEQLQAIYRLDDDERDREIERLCRLHPHLKEFFEARPPPPRFYPSDAYMADFWTHDVPWQRSEIERLCAAHPHLRRWFAAGGKKKRRERRDGGNKPARHAIVDSHSVAEWFFRIAIGITGGAIAGLAIGYVPSWIVSQIAGSMWGDKAGPAFLTLLLIGFSLLGVRAGVMLSNLIRLPRFPQREKGTRRRRRLEFVAPVIVVAAIGVSFVMRPSLGFSLVHGIGSLFQVSEISHGADAAEARPASDGTATTQDLNLRSGPGPHFDVVTIMPGGCHVTITGPDSDGWVPVEAHCDGANVVRGYAKHRYLSR